MSDLNHIILNGNNASLPYITHNRGPGFNFKEGRNIGRHGRNIKTSFNTAVSEFTDGDEDYDFVYIEFESAINFELAFDSFEDAVGNYRLASCKAIFSNDDGNEKITYKIAVYLNKNAVANFLNKVEKYLTEETITGKPKNQNLIANIESIRAATLESFWQEPNIDFPSSNESVWWEVWFSGSDREGVEETLNSLSTDNILTNNRLLVFPDNVIGLIKATPEELGEQLLYIENLAEIRKPIETADFFTNLEKEWEGDFISNLRDRVNNQIVQNNVSVCLLDSGVNRVNPLLVDLITAENLDSVNPAWTSSDSYRNGHGTPMAGLIIYGDLTDPLSSSNSINVTNNIESIKIIDRIANDPDLYGQLTLEAIAIGEIMNPRNKRVVCLAITAAAEYTHLGRPSSWSAAIDQKMFGTIEDRNDNTVILVSGGNLLPDDRLNYPLSNDDFSIEDPAQAYNAITIGAYTNKDRIDVTVYPGAALLAQRGQMSPCNTTSVSWSKKWPRKPDVVFEGGNDAILNAEILDDESLKLLSTGVGGVGRAWLTTIADTSSATALASKFTSELFQKYPDLKPETIRALVIHSADWTNIMLDNRSLLSFSSLEKSILLSRVGYGIPNLEKAKYSAENSLNIIAERTIAPFKYEDSRIKTNEFHLFDLPWPTDILLDMAELDVKLKVTLSYFIEPNPGNKKYANEQSYRSHGLRFKMIDRNESVDRFKARVSKAIKDEQEDYVQEGSENWLLGSQVRDKGSIHKDIWVGSAADLALRNKIAIHPVGGWWKNRKKLNRFDSSVRYSLIISIETNEADIDIYNNVLNQITVSIPIDI